MTDAARPMADVCASISPLDGFVVRPWAVADATVLVAAWNDAEIARWNPVPPQPTLAFAESWIDGARQQNEASVGIDVVLEDDHIVGEIGIQIDPAQAIGELGFWIAEADRGRGVSKTLVRLAESLATALELRGLIALVDPANAAAVGLLHSVGWNELPTKSARLAFASGPLSS